VAAGLSVDLEGWRREFDELMLRVGARFGRVEPRRRMASFVRGLLAGLPRVNCWSIAEHAGERCPRGMQRLLSEAVWDEAGVRDDLRGYVLEHFADPAAVLVVDETGDLKKGTAVVILSFSVDHGCDLGFRVVDDDLDVAVAALRGSVCRRDRYWMVLFRGFWRGSRAWVPAWRCSPRR
jgi:DDE superfamily endonuclease